jgi:LuxR family maltose regulon positive regulatory protein
MLHYKLKAPTLPNGTIKRKMVEKKLLDLSRNKLSLVVAPAGYGKTTAVAQYLAGRPDKYAWFTLDESDNLPEKFWRCLIMSVALAVKDYGLLDFSIDNELILSDLVTYFFVDMLKTIPGNITLVIDDYHMIHNDVIEASLAYFINRLPPNVNMILISRSEPDSKLFMADYKKTGIRIGVEELAFSFSETRELFDAKGIYLKDSEVAHLQKGTEGWAAGLVFASLYYEKTKDILSSFSDDNEYLCSFFENEVLNTLQDEYKEFLIQTSFLSTVSGQLCHRITGNEKSKEILRSLSGSNCFVSVLDQETASYKYHPLLKDFLFRIFSSRDPDYQQRLYHQAGEWYVENNEMEEAILSYVKAGEYDKAMALIADLYCGATISENMKFKGLIETIPESARETNLIICTQYAWILSMENQVEKADYWANKAQENYEKMKETADKAERQMMESRVTAAQTIISIIKRDADMLERHIKKLTGLKYSHSLTTELNVGEISMVKTVFGFKGCLNLIDAVYGKYMDMLPEILGDVFAYFAVIFAECQYERNNLNAVCKTLSNQMGSIMRLGRPGVAVPCILLLAKDKLAKGLVSEAFDLIESNRKLIEVEEDSIWQRYFDLFTAYLYIYNGDPDSAEYYLNIDDKSIFDKLTCTNEYGYIVYVRYLMQMNKLDEALLYLGRLEEFARHENRRASLIEILVLKAVNHYLRGESAESMTALDAALGFGMADGYVRTFLSEGQLMAELLTKYRAWEKSRGEQKHQKYVRALIDSMNSFIKASAPCDQAEAPEVESAPAQGLLSSRELEVLNLLVAEYSNAEIAGELFITERTVKHHNARIYEKLGVKNRLEAILKAKEIKLIS